MITGFYLAWFAEEIARPAHWVLAIEEDGISRPRPCPAEMAMEYMTQITAFRPGELDGFTLYQHPGKGWQMSVRRQGEPGWSVKIIPDEQARAILALLTASGHPDGPITVGPITAAASAMGVPAAQVAADYKAADYSGEVMRLLQAAAAGRDELTTAIRARVAL